MSFLRRRALCLEDLRERVLAPLRESRSLRTTLDWAAPGSAGSDRRAFEFVDLDVLVVEGLFLLRRDIRGSFDLSFWVECSFDTALERAIEARHGSAAAVLALHDQVLLPALKMHLHCDDPRSHADGVIVDDPRLQTPGWLDGDRCC
jgi:uridine kinase